MKYGAPRTGQRFGRWVVIGKERKNSTGYREVPCKCECGTRKNVDLSNLFRGRSISCGCFRAEHPASRRHGESKTRLHIIWCGIQQRCKDSNSSLFQFYGARGVTVCNTWRTYEPFRDWAKANGYAENLVIDRINTYGNYEPSNCRWVTKKQNARNARSNRLVTIFGETKCIGEWADDPRCVVSYHTLHARIHVRQWNAQRALITPPLQ